MLLTSGNGPELPFASFIDWQTAVVMLPQARLPELHFILRSFAAADVLEMRRKGRFYLENYLFSSTGSFLLEFYLCLALTRALLAFVRHSIKSPTLELAPQSQFYSVSEPTAQYAPSPTRPPYDDEYLGPVEGAQDSAGFNHNFSAMGMVSESGR